MSLDSRLRDMLRDSSFELPGWDDPVGRVGRGIRRRRRNRLAIGMATLAVLVAVPTLLSQQSFQEQPGVSSPIAFVAGEELGPPA